jgi:hypothetical protein
MDTFATAITCIDGRVQEPVVAWVRLNAKVRYVDLITEPGPDKELSGDNAVIVSEIVRKALFSIEHHHSNLVALAGHEPCAANPVSKENQLAQIIAGVQVLKSHQMPVRIVGLWVTKAGVVELVCDSEGREASRS